MNLPYNYKYPSVCPSGLWRNAIFSSLNSDTGLISLRFLCRFISYMGIYSINILYVILSVWLQKAEMKKNMKILKCGQRFRDFFDLWFLFCLLFNLHFLISFLLIELCSIWMLTSLYFLIVFFFFVNVCLLSLAIWMFSFLRSVSARRWEGDGFDARPKPCHN